MTTAPADHSVELEKLAGLISAQREYLRACFDSVDHSETITGIPCQTRMFHLRFDGNGEPKVGDLCDCLTWHIIHFCLSAKSRPSPMSDIDAVKYTQRARRLFIRKDPTADDPDATGQAGEMLLYFLLEALLEAPQVVAKMELKTNPNFEVLGSDGIHMKWNEVEQLVELYFGEAKLYQSVKSAIASAISSIEKFHEKEMKRHECSLVTAHFKYADSRLLDVITGILEGKLPEVGVRLNHACLIGYNWDEYGRLPRDQTISVLNAQFRKRYLQDGARIHGLLQERLDSFARKYLRLEVIFLPFRSVQEFRDAFNSALA